LRRFRIRGRRDGLGEVVDLGAELLRALFQFWDLTVPVLLAARRDLLADVRMVPEQDVHETRTALKELGLADELKVGEAEPLK